MAGPPEEHPPGDRDPRGNHQKEGSKKKILAAAILGTMGLGGCTLTFPEAPMNPAVDAAKLVALKKRWSVTAPSPPTRRPRPAIRSSMLPERP